ncbi:MAG: hypothetical protein U0401_18725 [Anaerolineae bacterium]
MSVAWGDVDGDGGLDPAVVGNGNTRPNRLYRNDNGTLTQSAVHLRPKAATPIV